MYFQTCEDKKMEWIPRKPGFQNFKAIEELRNSYPYSDLIFTFWLIISNLCLHMIYLHTQFHFDFSFLTEVITQKLVFSWGHFWLWPQSKWPLTQCKPQYLNKRFLFDTSFVLIGNGFSIVVSCDLDFGQSDHK